MVGSGSGEDRDSFSIRKAVLEDADQIRRCLREAFAPYEASYTTCAFVDTVLTEEGIRKRLADMTVLVAVDQARHIIGTIAHHAIGTGEGHIRGMAVRPEWQASGIAQKLLDTTDAELRGMHCIVLTLDTTRPLHRAIRFYEKNGFRCTGNVAPYFGMELLGYRKDIE